MAELTRDEVAWRDKIASKYDLFSLWGVPRSLWFQVDDLDFRRRENVNYEWQYETRSSTFVPWEPPVKVAMKSYEAVFSFNNQPFYRWTTPWGKRHRHDNVFTEWAYNFAMSHPIGSSFLKIEDEMIPVSLASVNTGVYRGKLGLKEIWTSSPVLPPSVIRSPTPLTTLTAAGGTAISRCIPTNPAASLSTFLGELRRAKDIPSPMLLSIYKERTRNLLSNSGGEYLNYVFGWKPMVDDLRSFATTIRDRKATIDQYHRDAGQKVRRQYEFPTERTTTIYDNVRFRTGNVTTGYAFVDGRVEHTEETQKWFSGAFRYYLPDGNSTLGKWERYADEADRLLGTDLTPEVLWNLSPWSWMLDWFGSIGDVMTNISALGHDGTVMQYGYLMERKKVQQIWTGSFNGQPLKTINSYSTKRRIPASPYGFGVNFESLSTKQLAILAALGLSHSP